MPMTKLF